MRIETRGFDIYVTFDEAAFQRILENGKYAWREAIDCIKAQFPFPIGRYDGQDKMWIIDKSADIKAGEKLAAIKKEFFQDRNQLELL
jgi:hypothetical protein